MAIAARASSRAGTALLRAIQGFQGVHAGSPDHESTLDLLGRVHDNITAGKNTTEINSPGKRESVGAAQRHMPAEPSHGPSAGNAYSTQPQGEATHDEPEPYWQKFNTSNQNLTGTEAVNTGGQARSVAAHGRVPFGEHSLANLRKQAGEANAHRFNQQGGRKVNPPQTARPGAKLVGDVSTNKIPTSRNVQSTGNAREKVPAFSAPPIAGNKGFAAAEQKARERIRK